VRGETIKPVALWSVVFTKYFSGDEIKKNEMSGVSGMYEGQEMCIEGFGGET